MDKKKILEDLIKRKVILISDHDKPFKLSSGVTSHHYYNSKNCILDPQGLDLISELLLKEVRKFNVKSVGGLETGSIPLVSAICLKSSLTESNPLSAFFVRKEPKKHGPQADGPLAYFEGNPISPIVIVDDVITTGNSVIDKTLDRIKKLGSMEVIGIVCIIDREQGADRLFKKHNLEFYSLFKHSNFKEFIDKKIMEKKKRYENKQTKKLESQSIPL